MRHFIRAGAILLAAYLSVAGTPAAACEEIFAESGKPVHTAGGDDYIEICRLGYLLSFDPETKVADWVLERIDAGHLTGNANRANNFRSDPDLPDGVAPTLADYRGSGYDRGHLAPAADMVWSQQAMDESFYLSNMAPQVGLGFNRGVWRALETRIRDWTKAGQTPLVVATGPVYGHRRLSIGDGVVVPAMFYKVVYEPENRRAIGFLLPNAAADFHDFERHIVAIDAIETVTGLDFLAALSTEEQEALESRASDLWD